MIPWVIAATGAAVALTVACDGLAWRRLEWLAKPAASAGFIAVAVLSGASSSPYGLAVLAALALSFVGDVALIPRGKTGPFLVGLGAFLLGHVGFCAAFVVRGVGGTHAAVGGVVSVALALAVGRWLLPNVKGGMRNPVIAYIAVITAMVALSVGVMGGPEPDPRIPAAAMAFWLSDICVARNRFVSPGFVNRGIGLPLYYAAQVVFALTVAPPAS